MSETDFIATLDEFKKFIENRDRSIFRFADEWFEATTWGWDPSVFEELYTIYVRSTQIVLSERDDPTKLKGAPLERLSRYFLEKGGIARGIVPINEHGRWQVDGQGTLNKSATKKFFGTRISEDCGFQLYLEAKNHSDPIEKSEFAEHCLRMADHGCNLGITVSTSGYKIGRGLGIATLPYIHFLQKRYHLLLVFGSFFRVMHERVAPFALLQDILGYAANNSYENDRTIQSFYRKEECKELAKMEFARLFGKNNLIS